MGKFLMSIIITILTCEVNSINSRVCWYTSRRAGILSFQQIQATSNNAEKIKNDEMKGFNKTCPKKTNHCYSLWKENHKNNSSTEIIILAQGCWESSGMPECELLNCIASRKPPKALNDTNFCCCKGDFCNGNMSQNYRAEENEVFISSERRHGESRYILVLIILIVFFTLIITCPLVLMFIFRNKDRTKEEIIKSRQNSMRLLEKSGAFHDPYFTYDNLKLDDLIGKGKYGSVWKGKVGDQEVAVKIFPSHNKRYFYNELDAYCVPLMSHSSLLSYFGYDERVGSDGNKEFLLFLSLVPNGTLQGFLNCNTIDWNIFSKMVLSIAKGVAYLHSDIRKGDKFKPCVAHRDLNSKNILVKEDLSCVICDLGFATKISGSKYYYNGEEQQADIKSINDVGTLRYMSPEVLEGAVNLHDCETALKQIDVYALGLILWEISTRCKDFYPPGVDCKPYRLPFEEEIGCPTFEQMQILVCKHKARPLFPDFWRDSLAVRSVKETIEDCWDQDAEARLTALCVEERFHELTEICEKQKKVYLYSSIGTIPTARVNFVEKDLQNILLVNETKEEESCISESTMDTYLAVTPAAAKNLNSLQEVCSTVQPHQGRNPCLERNLMIQSDLDSHTRTFIEKSHKSTFSDSLDFSVPIEFLKLNHSIVPADLPNLFNSDNTNQSEPVLRSKTGISFTNESFVDLSSPTEVLNLKSDTEVSLLQNGKLKTKVNSKNNEEFSKNISCGETSIDSSICQLGIKNCKRPNTLSLKQTENNSSLHFQAEKNILDLTKVLKNVNSSRSNPLKPS